MNLPPSRDVRREQIVHAAWLYHERGLNQQAVAERLEVSRSTVSRLLAEAERLGIVRVVLTEPLPESARLAEAVVERFGLASVTVEPALDGETPLEAAAMALARRVERMLTGGATTLATGWGRTLGAAAQRVRAGRVGGVTIVDAFGHTTTSDIADSVEVSNTLAARVGGRVVHVPAPGFAASAQVAASFGDSPSVRDTLDLARRADAVLVAIGVTGDDSLLVRAGYITAGQMRRVIDAGAVGEIFGRYFDAEGNDVLPEILHPISLSLDDLRRAKLVIAAAGGADKSAAVRGAIAAGAVGELAIDDELARSLVESD